MNYTQSRTENSSRSGDAADDAYSLSLLREYENDPDPEKNQTFTLEDCKKEWGLS